MDHPIMNTEKEEEEVENLVQNLPKANCFGGKIPMVNYEGFWYPLGPSTFEDTLRFQQSFRARDSDLIISSHPKTGTTWLKSLLFAVVNRSDSPGPSSLPSHPHELIYRLENEIYGQDHSPSCPSPDRLDDLPSPRLFSTHFPYTSLPPSITATSSGCRVLYISRNPLDTCVSQWHFYSKAFEKLMEVGLFADPLVASVEDYFEDFFQGRVFYGPFLDHSLGYWRASLERPEKVLFLKYEDLKEDAAGGLKRVAEFAGVPFSLQEEREGVVEEIVRACSIKEMKGAEANTNGLIMKYFDKKSYFRKGEVGDWRNYLGPSMGERMRKLMDEKLVGTGLSFKLLP